MSGPAASGRRYDLVLLDFDGTLADTFPWFSDVLNGVADRYGFRRVAAHEVDMLRGLDSRAVLRHLGIPAWKLPFIARHMRRLALADGHRMRMFPGVEAMLAALKDAGLTLGIVSSNGEAHIRRVLGPAAAARIDHYAGGAALFGKARRLRGAMRAAGAKASGTLYVGDELRDLDAAVEAGCDFAAVAWGYTRIAALAARGPALILTEPAALPRLVIVSDLRRASDGQEPSGQAV